MGIKLFGKNIAQVYTHHIMKIDYDAVHNKPECDYVLHKIDTDRIAETLAPIGTTVTVSNLKRLISKNKNLCEGFIFGEMGGYQIGTRWVMYKGADYPEYRIRDIDAYICDVFVNEQFRGRGYAGEMIRQLMEYLHEKGIDAAHLAVAKTNKSAIRAYEQTGFIPVSDKKFARILKINIPYHKL